MKLEFEELCEAFHQTVGVRWKKEDPHKPKPSSEITTDFCVQESESLLKLIN